MDRINQPINHDMIILARQSRGLTQGELANRIGTIKQFNLSKMENGLRYISVENLSLIAKALDYPIEFFYQKYPLTGPGISELFHRKRASVSAKTLEKVHASITIKCMQIKKLLNSVDMETLPMPNYATGSYTPEAAAKMLRATWNLPNGPLRNTVRIIENAGGIIIPMEFESPKIDAISRRLENGVPVFFVDFTKPMDRLRFSLCHELGHMVLHHEVSPTIEAEADAFASEILMPRNEIKFDLENLQFKDLPELKLKWKTSMAAIIMRAKSIGKINDSQFRRLYVTLSKRGYRLREPEALDPSRETPSLYFDLIRIHLNALDYSDKDLCKLLCVNGNDYREMQQVGRPTLRIIK